MKKDYAAPSITWATLSASAGVESQDDESVTPKAVSTETVNSLQICQESLALAKGEETLLSHRPPVSVSS